MPATDLRLWLKADAGITQSNGAVSSWADQSGNGIAATQSTAASRPLVASASGRATVRFDGVDDTLRFPLALNGLNQLTLILVSSNAVDKTGVWAGSQNSALFWGETSSWGMVYLSPFQSNVQFRFGTGQTNNLPVYTRQANAGSALTITTAVKNGTAESLFVNGQSVLSRTAQYAALSGISGTGSLGCGSAGFAGDIAEVLVYSRALTSSERQSVESYLAAKYLGVAVATNQAPIVNAGPDLSVTLPSSAALNGSVNDDGLPSNTLTSKWSVVSGPGRVTFANASAAVTTASFSVGGPYVLRLTGSDGSLSTSDDVAVTVTAPAGTGSVPPTGLKLWLKADAGVRLSNGAVAAWADQSGSGITASQSNAAARPALAASAVNGKPALTFDGVDDALAFPLPLNGLTGLTLVVVSSNAVDRQGQWVGSQYPALFWGETASWGMVYLSPLQSNVQFRFGTGESNNLPVYNRPATLGSAFSLTTAVKDGTAESLFVNGQLAVSRTAAYGALKGIADTGNLGHGSAFFAGQIAEVLVYARALSATERQSLEQYLTAKYLGGAAPVNAAPVVNAGPDQTITLPSGATLSGSATDDGLPSGTLTSSWSVASGPGAVTFANAAAPATTATFAAAGTYVLKLTASDGALSASDTVSVTVQAASVLVPTTSTAPAGSIDVAPDQDLQSLISANPEGATFYIRAGMHRLVNVTPKNGDSFLGEPGAILSGSRLLTSFSREGSYWVATGQTQQNQVHYGAVCLPDYPMCQYPEDLYFDDIPLRHVAQLSAVAPGKWFFDYPNDKIYFIDDPTGHKVEASVSRAAFSGSATNVTISGLIIEKYASLPQFGAIGDQYPGKSWTVENNEVRLNHGAGIAAADYTVVRSNYVHHNGQKGIGGNGANLLIDSNEIAFQTNWAGCDPAWEGGGTKFSLTTNLIVRNNNVHDNFATGLWTDIDNIGALIEGNTVVNNGGNGIAHEISYQAIIRNNIVKNNGSAGSGWLWGSQILIQNSQDVEVYGNTIDVPSTYGNGIGLIYQNRGSGAYGPYITRNNYVHNNSITHRRSPQGVNGAVADYDNATLWSGNNRFDSNAYHVTDLNASHWLWSDSYQTWSGMHANGQELNGTLDTVMPN